MSKECFESMYPIDKVDDIYIDTSHRILSLDQLPYSMQRGFEAALAASNHSDWPTRRTQMGSAIFIGSRLLSIGFNHFLKAKPFLSFIRTVISRNTTNHYMLSKLRWLRLDTVSIQHVRSSSCSYIEQMLRDNQHHPFHAHCVKAR